MNLSQLVDIIPNSQGRASIFLESLNNAMNEWGVITPLRQAHFLAQVLYESSTFQRLEENLNYSPQGLSLTWPKRFADTDANGVRKPGCPNGAALFYAHNPQLIANCVYAGRMGNGDEASGDGWRFRGRGLIQITGRDNYVLVGSLLKLPLTVNPDLLLQPPYACRSAGAFWDHNGLNDLADKDDFVGITKFVNGGTEGLVGRQTYLTRAKKALLGAQP